MIRWITDALGTGVWDEVEKFPDIQMIDVRDLVDKSGNTPLAVKAKIDEALSHLQNNKKVVVCCDYGMSRSNAIASGILAASTGISLDRAIKNVIAATGETAIRIEIISAVRQAIGRETQTESLSATKARRLLVTGAYGFIGSVLMLKLKDQYEIVAPARSELDLVKDAIPLDLLVKDSGIDAIVHLANPKVYTNESLGTTIVMLKNVLDIVKENQLDLIYLSGWEIYSGYQTGELRANESLPAYPGGTYGQTKFLCETLIEHYRRYHQLNCAILRSSPVYGIGSDRPKFIWNFLNKALNNQEIVTHKYINGFPILDLLHVDDLCSALFAAIERRITGTINLGTGIGTSTASLAEHLVKYLGSQSKIRHNEINAYTSNIIMDISYAAHVLGWHPKINLLEGLKTLLELKISNR